METGNVPDRSNNMSVSIGLQIVMDRYRTEQKAIQYNGNIVLINLCKINDPRWVKKNVYVLILFLKLISCWEIITSKCQTDFLDNTCEKGLKQNKQTSTSNFKFSNKSAFQISASPNNFHFLKQTYDKKEYR